MGYLKPEYETYQDVKSTLGVWSAPLFVVAEIIFYYLVLTDSHRRALSDFPTLNTWIADVGLLSAALLSGLFLAVVFVHILEIHDHWYDRYLVRWRDRYDRDFIIPKLLEPYSSKLPDGFESIAKSKKKDVLSKLFYEFVRDRDPQISRNTIVRFYERITKYWLSQMSEVVFLLTLCLAFAYWTIGQVEEWPGLAFPIVALVLAISGWILSRLSALVLRREVRKATEEEIRAIHIERSEEFREALAAFCRQEGVAIGREENNS